MQYKKELVLEFKGLKINKLEQTVYFDGKEISFTNREFNVLYLLLQYQGQVFSKSQIYNQVTENNDKDELHTIEITISRIRKKLELYTGYKNWICTIRGRGYKFRK